MTRNRQAVFFKHGMDFIVFGPLSLVLGAAIAKLLWHGPGAQQAVAADCAGGSSISNGNGRCTNGPRPLFTVQESPRGLTITSVLNTMELEYASASSISSSSSGGTGVDKPAPPYSFCSTRLHGLGLLDYTLLSLLAYLEPGGPDFAALFRPL